MVVNGHRAVQSLLRAAMPYVAEYGFTRDALRAAAAATQTTVDTADLGALLSTPTGEVTRQLLSAFDQHGLEAAQASLPHVITKTMTGDNSPSVRQQHDKQAVERAELLLAGKLLYSVRVRKQLIDALASITASAAPLSPLAPAATTSFRAIPTPRPIVQRAWSVADEAVHMTQWKGNLRLDWYAHRARLSNAFLLAELHMLSPDFSGGGDAHASAQLLRRLARPHTLLPPLEGAHQWVKWGASGWLGIFRSLGL